MLASSKIPHMIEISLEFCWVCGKSISNCVCGSESVPMTIKKPTEILPACGVSTSGKYIDLPWYDPNRQDEVLPRPCCNCGKTWPTTYDGWINGTCPNCGASGAQLNKMFLKEHELTEINDNPTFPKIITEPKENIIPEIFKKLSFIKNNEEKIDLHLNLNGDSSGKI